MKIIRHSLLVDIEDKANRTILINTITSKMYVISPENADYVRRCKDAGYLINDVADANFIKDLVNEGFVVQNTETEEQLVDEIICNCRNRQKNLIDNSSVATFVLTYFCNFACPYCYEKGVKYNSAKIMSREMVDRVFDINDGHIRNISLYGGEPLLPSTRAIVEYIITKAPNSLYSVTTNGYYLEEFMDIFNKIRVSHIMVTLDGPRHIHDKTRILKSGDGTYDKIFRGIELLLQNAIPIKIRMNISENNVDACIDLRRELIRFFEKQFDEQLLQFELQTIFQLPPETRAELNDKIIFAAQTPKGTPYKYNTIAYTASPVLMSFINNTKVPFKPFYCNCDAEGKQRFFDAEGDIYSCILALKNKAARVGTYFPSISYEKNSMLSRNIETVSECRQCILKFLCGGGCANELIGAGKDIMNPNCSQIQRELFEDLPRLFRQRTTTQNE